MMLIVKRNAMRDYIDACAISDWINKNKKDSATIINNIEYYYKNSDNLKQQIIAQLSSPQPYDFSEKELINYKNIEEPYNNWKYICKQMNELGVKIQNMDISVTYSASMSQGVELHKMQKNDSKKHFKP